MQDLKRLAKIIAENSPKALPVVDQADHSSLEGKLYHFIIENDSLSDEEACAYLYGERKLTASYRMLKSRLRKKLLNGLYFIELDAEFIRAYQIKYVECFSLIQQAKVMIALNNFFLAEKLADQAVTIARKANLNDILYMAYDIKQQADLISNDRNKFEKNYKLLLEYASRESQEREALFIYNRLKVDINFGIGSFRKQVELYKKGVSQLDELWKVSKSSRIFNFYHTIQIACFESLGNYEGILDFIRKSEMLLSDGIVNEFWFNDKLNYFIKVYACLRLKKLDEGLEFARQYLSYFKCGTTNWFAFIENYLALALHKNDIELSCSLCTTVVQAGVLEHPVPGVRERWGLYLRFCQLIADKTSEFTAINITSNQLETSFITKDKEGRNLPLLLLDYLEKLPHLDTEDLYQYEMRFSKYAAKYLKGEMGARASQFIKLLILSMKVDVRELEKKAKPLYQKLKNTPPTRDPIAEVEIVPYEHLWELVLEIMQNKGKK